MVRSQEDPNVAFCCPHRATQDAERDRWLPSSKTEGIYHCSHCGSIRASDFIKLVENGCEVTATDKDYKVYVGDFKFYFFHLDSITSRTFKKLFESNSIKFYRNVKFYVSPRLLRD